MTAVPQSPVRVMIVDDSAVVRGMIHNALKGHPMIEVVASASTGLMAINMLRRNPVDIVLLDIEMPEMDGMTALPQICEIAPAARVIMVSTLTLRNAEISLRALEMGASDYVPKPQSRGDSNALSNFYRELVSKILALAGRESGEIPLVVKPVVPSAPTPLPQKKAVPPQARPPLYPENEIKAIAIGSSTGGPQALQKLFGMLKGHLKHLPFFVTQHMPATFTTILAQQLGQVAERPCEESQDQGNVQPNHIYIARGDYHLMPVTYGSSVMLRQSQDPPENFCRPAVDPMLRALTKIYGKHLLIIILTGMGQDGLEGARIAVAEGATVIAQDEASCVVYGMPKAVMDAGIASAAMPIEEIVNYLIKVCGRVS